MVKSSGFFALCPAVWAALGAALSYYTLTGKGRAGFGLWIAFLFTVLISMFRVLGTFPALVSRPLKNTRLFHEITLSLAALAAGFSLGFTARIAVPGPPQFGIRQGEITGLTGTLKDDPRGLAGGRGMAYLDLEQAAGKDGLRSSAGGEVLVFFPEEAVPRLRDFGRLSRIYIEGAFLPSKTGSPVFRTAGVHVMEAPPPMERLRTGIRLNIIGKFSPRKWGGLALALLLGVRDSLETELAASYREAGCSHVLALSGMHLAIVSSVIAFLLKKPLGIKAAAILGAVFILLYTALVGVQPSLERAALMYLLGTLTILGAFPRRASALLALAFVIQICINPASGDSISFILSYLALAGILALGEPVKGLFRGVLPDALSRPLSASLGAFIATAAVSAVFFGVLYPVGIIAGLVVVPLTTVFMVAAMAYLAAAFLLPPLTGPLGTALSFLYEALSRIVGWAGRVPDVEAANPHAVLIASIAVSLVLVSAMKHRSERGRRLVPFAAA
jgi:competence protein ComEC